MATNVSSVVNQYTYTYNNQIRPKLDKDDDGVWNKTEIQNYADSYKKATGKTLDVDKLVESYGNEDGVIDAKAQEKMLKDDALGLSVLQGTSSGTSSTGSTTTTTNTAGSGAAAKAMSAEQKAVINDVVKAFTFSYGEKLQPLLDKDEDGMWSKDELTNYAGAYQKATGKTLDVDKLMEQYGNEDGFIDPTNQAKMKNADALGMANLKSALDSAKAASTVAYNDAKASGSKKNSDYSLDELLETMSSSGKARFSMMMNKMESQSSLLNNFISTSTSNSFDMLSMLSNSNTLQMYRSMGTSAAGSAMSGQMMNFTL